MPAAAARRRIMTHAPDWSIELPAIISPGALTTTTDTYIVAGADRGRRRRGRLALRRILHVPKVLISEPGNVREAPVGRAAPTEARFPVAIQAGCIPTPFSSKPTPSPSCASTCDGLLFN